MSENTINQLNTTNRITQQDTRITDLGNPLITMSGVAEVAQKAGMHIHIPNTDYLMPNSYDPNFLQVEKSPGIPLNITGSESFIVPTALKLELIKEYVEFVIMMNKHGISIGNHSSYPLLIEQNNDGTWKWWMKNPGKSKPQTQLPKEELTQLLNVAEMDNSGWDILLLNCFAGDDITVGMTAIPEKIKLLVMDYNNLKITSIDELKIRLDAIGPEDIKLAEENRLKLLKNKQSLVVGTIPLRETQSKLEVINIDPEQEVNQNFQPIVNRTIRKMCSATLSTEVTNIVIHAFVNEIKKGTYFNINELNKLCELIERKILNLTQLIVEAKGFEIISKMKYKPKDNSDQILQRINNLKQGTIRYNVLEPISQASSAITTSDDLEEKLNNWSYELALKCQEIAGERILKERKYK